ncbi:MAG: Gfo/Idh/MocA family oxidoreductase [Candidatus Dormibacteria bacterium]|jgi:predicted dehydrogenase
MTSIERPLRIGFLGAGFIADFHLQALRAVRDAEVRAVYDLSPDHSRQLADRANAYGLGPCRAVNSVEDLIVAGDVDAIWILSPNYTRVEHMRAIRETVGSGRGHLIGVACEKPLGRSLAEAAEMLRLVSEAGLLHGYLENQVFAPAVRRGREVLWRRAAVAAGRPYLARATEEHSGPHRPWFWRGEQAGGGVLLDMMCHSVEVGRYLLTEPGRDSFSLHPVSVTGTTATLKWNQPGFARELRSAMGDEVDYTVAPSEDFAQGVVCFVDESGAEVMVQASNSWAYVGPGLRIHLEVLGPEYAFESDSLASGTSIFLSRRVGGVPGEDLVEKQNAEQGLLPLLDDEAATYGYVLEDRHMVAAFRAGEQPEESFRDGVEVMTLLMALYRSAEEGRTIALPDSTLEEFVPLVARGPKHRAGA